LEESPVFPEMLIEKSLHKSRHTGIAFEGLQKIKEVHKEGEPDFLLRSMGAPRKVADFSGQKPWMACEND